MDPLAGLRNAFDTANVTCAAHGCTEPVCTTGYGPGKPVPECVTRQFCRAHAVELLDFRNELDSFRG